MRARGIVWVGDPDDVGLVVHGLRHCWQVVPVVLRWHYDGPRAARLRRERIDGKGVLRVHRGAARPEECERDELEHVVRAVAENNRGGIDAVALRERALQLEAVAVR